MAPAVCVVVGLGGQEPANTGRSYEDESATFQDPAVPLIALPTDLGLPTREKGGQAR